jgi:hypothetical protein
MLLINQSCQYQLALMSLFNQNKQAISTIKIPIFIQNGHDMVNITNHFIFTMPKQEIYD